MYKLCLPRLPGGGACAMAVAAAVVACVCFSGPALSVQSGTAAADPVIAAPQDQLQEAEQNALIARAQSLEVLGRYLWESNLSASRARLKAAELRNVARVLLEEARENLDRAQSDGELEVATRRLEIVRNTSSILDDIADRLERTRGTRRKIRILGLELSREAWKVVRENELPVTQDQPVLPGQLFKDNPPAPSPRQRAFLKEPKKDYLTYSRGAILSQELVLRGERRKARLVVPLPEDRLYYREGAITLSPLDQDHRAGRIWWSEPPEDLAWKVEQW